MKHIFSIFFIAASFVMMSASSETGSIMTDAEILNATKHLENFSKVNYEPKYITPAVSALCAQSSPTSSASGGDPHVGRYIDVYVNDKGFDEMTTKKKPVFPEGTMILKEKMPADSAKKYGAPELFTVMIKREKGYNASCGDWEFASVDVKTSKIERGKTASCMSCHTKYTGTDFIKRDYLSLKYVKTLK